MSLQSLDMKPCKGASAAQVRSGYPGVCLVLQTRFLLPDEVVRHRSHLRKSRPRGPWVSPAALMMTLLKKVAIDNQVAILCTIHQPSASVWAGFDNALILSMGRTAYCGPAAKLGDYCASLGKPVPELANPAEFFLNLVNAPPPSTVPFACVHTHPPTPPPSLSRPPSSLSPSTLNLAQR